MKTQQTQNPLITLYGNVGGDPEIKTIAGKEFTKEIYDAIIDDVVERQYTSKDKELRTFSVAVSKKDDAGTEVTRWIRCSDWKGNSKLLRKGDRVALKGFFREHTYEKDGEQKTARDFNVLEVSVQKRKLRDHAE